MSLKDRIREAAQQAQEGLAKGAQQAQEGLAKGAQQAQEGLAKGQAKLEQVQRDRQSGGSELEALGQAYWVLQSGRATEAQVETLLEAVRPAILQRETRLGPLPWPTVPSGSSGAGTPPSDTTPPASTPGPGVSGPVGAPSSIPDAIHHDPPAE
jgi:hypothetical protein